MTQVEGYKGLANRTFELWVDEICGIWRDAGLVTFIADRPDGYWQFTDKGRALKAESVTYRRWVEPYGLMGKALWSVLHEEWNRHVKHGHPRE